MSEKAKTYKTLNELVKAEPKSILDPKRRPYRVISGKDQFYVVSNSPGNAALEVCDVETVKPLEIKKAAFEALCEEAKEATQTPEA